MPTSSVVWHTLDVGRSLCLMVNEKSEMNGTVKALSRTYWESVLIPPLKLSLQPWSCASISLIHELKVIIHLTTSPRRCENWLMFSKHNADKKHLGKCQVLSDSMMLPSLKLFSSSHLSIFDLLLFDSLWLNFLFCVLGKKKLIERQVLVLFKDYLLCHMFKLQVLLSNFILEPIIFFQLKISLVGTNQLARQI